jgi:hypothetical protein
VAKKPVQGELKIGWAQVDITPPGPSLVCGQFFARISEEVWDPVTATALALESGGEQAVLVSCDLVAVPDDLRDAVRRHLREGADGLDPMKVVLGATHTHTGPEVRIPGWSAGTTAATLGVELKAMDGNEYQPLAAERIAVAVRKAWAARAPGGVGFGMGYAVIGRNRRWVDTTGKACMYGNTDTPLFSHIEGYEDHSLGLVATIDPAGKLTGLVVNVPCPSQVSEIEFAISADYWCETRQELRRRFGKDLFILPQCSAAGDQSPHLIYDKRSAQRMLDLKGRTVRQEIAQRIANAVEEILPFVAATADRAPQFTHRVETLDLPRNALVQADVDAALAEADKLRLCYEEEMRKLQADPSLKNQPRWYQVPTDFHRRMKWQQAVADRFEQQKTQPNMPVEFHVLRLGELAVATNPFEYYLDFGVFIKARSPAVQTLLVQLAGGGSYCPSRRSLAGGGYGSLPASNPIGPEGGRKLAERTVEVLRSLWPQM